MPQRSVATNYTFEQQRTEINLLAADFWSQKTNVDNASSTYLKHDGSNDFTGATLNVPSSFTISPDSGNGTLTISGNLNVTGTQTVVNTTILNITDKNITLAAGNTLDANADGAGITIDCPTDKTFTFNNSKASFVSNIGLEATTFVAAPYGHFTGSGTPTTGYGVEVNAPDENTGQITSYHRGNSAYKELRIKGSSVGVYTGTTNALEASFNSSGLSVEGITTAKSGLVVGSANQTKAQDGVIIERNSGSGIAHISAGRSGGNFSGFEFYVAGASGVTKRLSLDYEGNQQFYKEDGSTSQFYIKSDGKVGIGVTSLTAQLTIDGASQAMASEGTLKIQAPAEGADVGGGITFGNNVARRAAIVGKQEGSGTNLNGYLAFGTRGSSGDIQERLRISSSGYMQMKNASGSTFALLRNEAQADSTSLLGSIDFGSIDWDSSVAQISSYQDGAKDKGSLRFYTQPSVGDGIQERLRIKSTGEVHISDRNSSNTGDHFFQAGAFGIRMEDTGGYNRWNIERNYGGFQSTPLVHLSAEGRVGINQDTPTADLEVVPAGTSTTSTLFINTPTHNTNVASEAILKFGYGHSGSPDGVGHIKMVENATNSFDADFIFGLPANNSSGGSVTNEALRLDSSGNLHLRSAATCRLVLGSSGGAVGSLTNNENWIRGSGNLLQLNTAGGDYGFEILGNEKMKLDSNGNLELRSATQNRITFGSSGSSGNDTNWVRGDGSALMFNGMSSQKWEIAGNQVMEMTDNSIISNKVITNKVGSYAHYSRPLLEITSGGTPTQCKILTKIPWTGDSSHAHSVRISGFRYASAQAVDLQICWHVYNNSFYNRAVSSSGAWAPTVTLAVENGFVVIHLTNPGYWPKFYVESLYHAFGSAGQAEDWSWTDAAINGDSGLPVETVPYKSAFGNGTTISGESNGETNMYITGSNSTLGARLILKNTDTTANCYNDLSFCDAGGQSTSIVRGINHNDASNEGYLEFHCRPNGGLPTKWMDITATGELRTFVSTGKESHNYCKYFQWGGYAQCSATWSVSIPNLQQGNIYRIMAYHSHHSMSYGSYIEGVYGAYSSHSGLQIDTDYHNVSSGAGGSWDVTRGGTNGDPIVITHTGGTYNGYGHWFIWVLSGTT